MGERGAGNHGGGRGGNAWPVIKTWEVWGQPGLHSPFQSLRSSQEKTRECGTSWSLSWLVRRTRTSGQNGEKNQWVWKEVASEGSLTPPAPCHTETSQKHKRFLSSDQLLRRSHWMESGAEGAFCAPTGIAANEKSWREGQTEPTVQQQCHSSPPTTQPVACQVVPKDILPMVTQEWGLGLQKIKYKP